MRQELRESYVYLYLRENLFSPYYVGKGKGWRDTNRHTHNVSVPTDKNLIRRVKINLTNREACQLEDTLIAFYGLESEGGVLKNKNKTHNQSPDRTGQRNTPEQNANISKACQGRVPWNKGKQVGSYGEKRRKNISESKKIKVQVGGVVYASTQDAAEALGVSRRTLWRWKRTGKAVEVSTPTT